MLVFFKSTDCTALGSCICVIVEEEEGGECCCPFWPTTTTTDEEEYTIGCKKAYCCASSSDEIGIVSFMYLKRDDTRCLESKGCRTLLKGGGGIIIRNVE